MVKKKRCTAKTAGEIVGLRRQGQNLAKIISVEYEVEGEKYEVKESLKMKSEWIKIGFLPIGQKKRPVMGDFNIGDTAEVSYNPDNPKESFITKNEGIFV